MTYFGTTRSRSLIGMSAYRSRRLAEPSTPLDERHGRCRSRATWPSALPYRLPCRRATARARKAPASDLLWRLADEDCLMGVQLGFMGVQLGGKVIWAGVAGLRLRRGNCRATSVKRAYEPDPVTTRAAGLG